VSHGGVRFLFFGVGSRDLFVFKTLHNMNVDFLRVLYWSIIVRIGAPFDFTGLNPISPTKLYYYL
jgi:hypothetical protein